jgi:hypothetical protein
MNLCRGPRLSCLTFLECFDDFDPLWNDTSDEADIPSGKLHPGRGGELRIHGSEGKRLALFLEKHVYAIHGRLIERTAIR